MRKFLIAATLAAFSITAAPVYADPPPWAPAHGKRAKGYKYDSKGRYYEPRRMTRSDYIWRGDNGHYHCRRDNGTTGLIIGAGVGALAGYEIAGQGNRTIGAIIGGTAGGLLGREIDRGDIKCS